MTSLKRKPLYYKALDYENEIKRARNTMLETTFYLAMYKCKNGHNVSVTQIKFIQFLDEGCNYPKITKFFISKFCHFSV